LLDLAVFIFAANDEPNIFALFEDILAFENVSFVFSLYICKPPRNARKNCAHAKPNRLTKRFLEWKVLLVDFGVFRNRQHDVRRMSFLQFLGDVFDRGFSDRNFDSVLRIEVSEMGELPGKFVMQAGISQNFSITVAFAPLDERRDQGSINVHASSLPRRQISALPGS